MKSDFSDYINDSIRILILLNAVKDRKSVKITEHKIKLYDYYLKFPCTMMTDSFQPSQQWNFDEYYSFFHWQPDLIRYRQSLNYLMAKCLIEKRLENSVIIYRITDLGVNALNSINNSYKDRLITLAEAFIPVVYKLSDTKIEQIIAEKSRICLRNGGVNFENKNNA